MFRFVYGGARPTALGRSRGLQYTFCLSSVLNTSDTKISYAK